MSERSAYDQFLVERSMLEEVAIDFAIRLGEMSDYLVGDEVDYYVNAPEQWERDFREEGRAYHRFQYTAEELFVRAHEHDKAAIGLHSMWPKIDRMGTYYGKEQR